MRTAWALLGVLLLAGCGQKGPLYLPDKKPAVVTTTAPVAAPPPAAPASPATPKKPDPEQDPSWVPAPAAPE